MNGFDPTEFVNRETELDAFETLAEGETRERLLVFSGPLGIGKSALVRRLTLACRGKRAIFALMDFERGDLYEVEALAERLAVDLGGPLFDQVDEVLAAQEQASGPGQTLADQLLAAEPGPAGAQTIDFRAGDIGAGAQVAAGQNIVQIRHAQINLAPQAESPRQRRRRLLLLGRAFRQGLEALLARQPVILFFDSCEEAPQEVLAWLQSELLDPLLQGRLALDRNLAVIMAGDPSRKRGPWIQQVCGYGAGVMAHELANLLPDAVRRYWVEIKGLSEALLPPAFLQAGAPPDLMRRMAELSASLGGPGCD